MQLGTIKLRSLTDREYDHSESLAQQLGKTLGECPTCADVGSYKLENQMYPCDCRVQKALFRHYLFAEIPAQYIDIDWRKFYGSPSLKKSVDAYLAKWESYKEHGLGLEIWGQNLGTGKTLAAAHIGKELVKQGQRVYYLSFQAMVAAFQQPNHHDLEKRLHESTYLILDEIVAPWTKAQGDLYSARYELLIRHRTDYNLPTIITTNLTQKDHLNYYPRIYSLLAAKQLRIEVEGKDARINNVNSERRRLAENGWRRPIT